KIAYYDSLESAGQDPENYGAKGFYRFLTLWNNAAINDGDLKQSFLSMLEGETLRSSTTFCSQPWDWDELGPTTPPDDITGMYSIGYYKITSFGRIQFLEP